VIRRPDSETGSAESDELERLCGRLGRVEAPFDEITRSRAEARLVDALAREPLLGYAELWERWFAEAGAPTRVTTVATFNDAGLMLQAVEQDLGLAISRELLAADALRAGLLVKLSPHATTYEMAFPYHVVYPPGLREWPPLLALRQWLREELALSASTLQPAPARPGARALAPRRGAAGAKPELR